MPLHNEISTIKVALSQISGVKLVTEGWPESFEILPCISISEAANTPHTFRDDRERTTELAYYVRIWAIIPAQRDSISSAVNDVMEGLRYTREFSYDEDGAGIRQKNQRYKKIL